MRSNYPNQSVVKFDPIFGPGDNSRSKKVGEKHFLMDMNAVNNCSNMTRGDFFRRAFGNSAPVLRPPWALPEEEFQDSCTTCDDCLKACPTNILKKARAGYPVVDFSAGECTFCGECVSSCKPKALTYSRGEQPWTLFAVIGTTCLSVQGVTCRVCGEQCDAGAISFEFKPGGLATPIINTPLCTGCGACVSPCPVQAVSMDMEA